VYWRFSAKSCFTSVREMLFFPGWFLSIEMQYRGKHYIVVHGIEPNSWKWTVDLDEQTAKSGEARTRGLAVSAVRSPGGQAADAKTRSSAT
jgi:hypothetical protein